MLMESKWENIKEMTGYNIQEVYEEDLEDDVGNKVTIVCMSDTHSTLNEIEHDIPSGDIFIHASDFTRYGLQSAVEEFNIITNCVYLEEEFVEFEGIKIYGSPWQPDFSHSAFNLPRGTDLLSKWRQMPSNTDVLVTHGPPLGVRDASLKTASTESGQEPTKAGCEDLLVEVLERVQPQFHIFGHIHEGNNHP